MKWKSIVLGCYKSAPTVTFIILRKLLPFDEIRFFVSDDGVWKNINIKYSYNYLHPSNHQNRNRNEINARNIEFSLGALGEIDLLDLVLHRRRRQQEEQEENTMNRAEEKSVWRIEDETVERGEMKNIIETFQWCNVVIIVTWLYRYYVSNQEFINSRKLGETFRVQIVLCVLNE